MLSHSVHTLFSSDDVGSSVVRGFILMVSTSGSDPYMSSTSKDSVSDDESSMGSENMRRESW